MGSETKRIQFDISNREAMRLRKLVHESGAISMAEVLRNALSLYDYFVQECSKGGRIQVVDTEKVIKEPIIPGINS